MAVYKVFNKSYKNAIQFTAPYDYNLKECLTIPPRGFIGGENGMLGSFMNSIDYGKTSLISDIFTYAEKNPDILEITKDGQAVNRAAYKQDFP